MEIILICDPLQHTFNLCLFSSTSTSHWNLAMIVRSTTLCFHRLPRFVIFLIVIKNRIPKFKFEQL